MTTQVVAMCRDQTMGVSDSHGKGFGLWPKCSRKSIMGFKREENDQIWMLEISLQ